MFGTTYAEMSKPMSAYDTLTPAVTTHPLQVIRVSSRGRVEVLCGCSALLAAPVYGSVHEGLTWALQAHDLHSAGADSASGSMSHVAPLDLTDDPKREIGPPTRIDPAHHLAGLDVSAERASEPLATAICRCAFVTKTTGHTLADAIEHALTTIATHCSDELAAVAVQQARQDALPSFRYVLTDGERSIEYVRKGVAPPGDIADAWGGAPWNVRVSEFDNKGTLLRSGSLDWDESRDDAVYSLGVHWDSGPTPRS